MHLQKYKRVSTWMVDYRTSSKLSLCISIVLCYMSNLTPLLFSQKCANVPAASVYYSGNYVFSFLLMFSVGNTYNIPICVWLLDTYPYNPPICFVKPTSTMMIKPGTHVDADGKFYLPYLHEWKPVSPCLLC